MAEVADGRLDELRQLIFGAELAQISRLTDRLDDPDVRSRELTQVLATARVRKSVEQLIRAVLKREPEVVVEVIRPVLLLAVKKAVTDAFREFSESLNQIAEKSLSLRSLRWRFEAWRTGRPFSDIMLSRSLLYSVREVFLIHGKTGIMLNQATTHAVAKDADMISSMFTAIQEFVRDSFVGSESTDLETIDAGSIKLWIQHGPYAMLAGAVDGTPPTELKSVFRTALDQIQDTYNSELKQFHGDVTPFEPAKPILEQCLLGRSAADPKKPVLLWLIVAACLLLVGFWSYFAIGNQRRWHGFFERVEKQPGFVVTRIEKEGSGYRIFGLRDQLAAQPVTLLQGTGISPGKVSFQFEPYQSLDPAFIQDRSFAADRESLQRQVIRFSQGDASLNAVALDRIEQISSIFSSLLRIASTKHPSLHFRITGHTDELGSGESNARLSSQRAEQVKAELVAAGVPASALLTRGVATSEPLRAGDSDRDRSFNRSVTFQVMDH